MKKPVSARRLKRKAQSTTSNISANEHELNHAQDLVDESKNILSNTDEMPDVQSTLEAMDIVNEGDQFALLASKLKGLEVVLAETNAQLMLERQNLEAKYESLVKQLNDKQNQQLEVVHRHYQQVIQKLGVEQEKNTQALLKQLQQHNEKLCQTIEQTNNNIIHHLTFLFKEEVKIIKEKLTRSKEEENIERTISFQLGREFFNGVESVKTLIGLPHRLQNLREETLKRKGLKAAKTVKTVNTVAQRPKLLEKFSFPSLDIQSKLNINHWLKSEIGQSEVAAANMRASLQKKTQADQSKLKLLSVVSQATFASLKKFNEINFLILDCDGQVANTQSNLFLLESCYHTFNDIWNYGLYSNNPEYPLTQKLLVALNTLKEKKIPIIFIDRLNVDQMPHFKLMREQADWVFVCSQLVYNAINSCKNVVKIDNYFNERIFNPTLNDIKISQSLVYVGEFLSSFNFLNSEFNEYLKTVVDCKGAVYKSPEVDTELYTDVQTVPVNTQDAQQLATAVREANILFYTPSAQEDFLSEQLLSYLACAKPVISTKNDFIEKELAGVVTTVDSPAQLEAAYKALMNDRWLRQRKAHLGYRYAMQYTSERFNQSLVKTFAKTDGLANVKKPLVSIVMATKREHFCDRIIQNLTRQSYEQMEIMIMTQEWSHAGREKLKSALLKSGKFKKVIVDSNDTDMTLGERLNICAQSASIESQYIAKMDDDDFYFDHYLSDMLLPFEHGQYAMTGKCENFIYLETVGKLVLTRDSRAAYRETEFVAGPTLVIKKTIFDKLGGFKSVNNGEDSDLIKRILAAGHKIFSTDSFNFVQFRSKNVTNHTWQAKAEIFEKSCTFVANTIDESIVAV